MGVSPLPALRFRRLNRPSVEEGPPFAWEWITITRHECIEVTCQAECWKASCARANSRMEELRWEIVLKGAKNRVFQNHLFGRRGGNLTGRLPDAIGEGVGVGPGIAIVARARLLESSFSIICGEQSFYLAKVIGKPGQSALSAVVPSILGQAPRPRSR